MKMSIDTFIQQLFTPKHYSKELILLYVFSGILAGLTRLTIKDGSKMKFKSWWADGSLLGCLLISVVGALLFDNNFLWSFLGGYFFIFILEGVQTIIKKGSKKV